jgi:hypothetical protein
VDNLKVAKTATEIKSKIAEGCKRLADEARKNPPKYEPSYQELQRQNTIDFLSAPLFKIPLQQPK